MRTNVLALPLALLDIVTGTNEDWIDAIVYLIDSDDIEEGPQLDLRNIRFAMHVRRAPPENEVVIEATTENAMIRIGEAPDFGYLVIWVPWSEMRNKVPGAYVGDIVAMDETNRRCFVQFNLNIVHGITRWEGLKALDGLGVRGVANVAPQGVTWQSQQVVEEAA